MNYIAYENLLPDIFRLLDDDMYANEKITEWLLSKYSTSESLKYENYNPYKDYVPSFSLEFVGNYVNTGRLTGWVGYQPGSNGNIYNKLHRFKKLFKMLGVKVAHDKDSPRAKLAQHFGLSGYLQATSKLYAYTPRAVAAFLLSSRTEDAVAFRFFMQDRSPEYPYCLGKLEKTICS